MWNIHIFLIATCSVILVHSAKSKYNDDEDNPYEFGFTIDGQQHRHEKKDANGIIQGEFGFITADGIYHVTVYATDEDGNFKILSMKNVRVSGPLDEPNAKLPDTSQFSKEGNKVAAPVPAKPIAVTNPLSIEPPSAPIQSVAPVHLAAPIQSITQRPNNFKFTTQPTIKPACAGCGYVTTQKSTNGGKLPFQTQAFQNPKPGTIVIGNRENVQEKQPLFVSNNPNNNQNYPQSAKPASTNYPLNNQAKPGFSTSYPNNQQPSNQGIPSSYPSSNDNNQDVSKPGFPTKYPVNNQGNQQSSNPGFPTKYPENNQGNQQSSNPGFPTKYPGNNQGNQQSSNPGFPNKYPGNNQANQQSSNPGFPTKYPGNNQGNQQSSNSGFPTNYPEINQENHFNNDQQNHQQSLPVHQPNDAPYNNQQPIAEAPYVNTLSIENNNPSQQNYNNPTPTALVVPKPIQSVSNPASDITVSNGFINVPNNPPIQIKDKFPNMVDGLPSGISTGDITDLLYKFNYTVGFHGHYEKGYKNGAKVGGYFVNDRDGVSRIVTYVADENGYRPKVKFIRLDLTSDLVPKEGSEKTFGLKNFEFVWYPLN